MTARRYNFTAPRAPGEPAPLAELPPRSPSLRQFGELAAAVLILVAPALALAASAIQ